MINIDGVILGNNRTSLAGNDLNRQYQDPDGYMHPEVLAIKDLFASIDKEKGDMADPIFMYLDMHAHS